ncbi:hypothetical protein GN958_ATG08793 [Phytophthora infestans]|uniref:Uncharacterized protein n=1 Tax=Phytophthora infestans TaxID=4787 RepID=A0A8S9UMF1_PHYIN|nr:hypothetical protein GN958_ATG15856 [Phytophthora infestans]KAF4142011.1 hypothetical protein GN958_ATG08793 [Phytophthora infestans]
MQPELSAGSIDVDMDPAKAEGITDDDINMEDVQEAPAQVAALPVPDGISALPSTSPAAPRRLPAPAPSQRQDVMAFHPTENRRVSDQYTTSIVSYSGSSN